MSPTPSFEFAISLRAVRFCLRPNRHTDAKPIDLQTLRHERRQRENGYAASLFIG